MALRRAGLELVAENAERYFSDLNKAEQSTRSFDRSIGDAAGGLGAREAMFTGFFDRIGEAAFETAVTAGEAFAGFLIDSVGAAGDFEAGLNKLGAVVGDSLAEVGLDLDDARKKALELGADTKFSADEALEAMTELAKGGVPVKEVMGEATDATLALAAAGDVELAQAGTIVAKTLAVWADRGLDATTATNLLAQAANASTVDLDELADGVATAQGRAALMGVEYEDLVTTMALVSGGFSSAQEAGTSLNNFYARLIPQTENAKEAMAELGLFTEETGSAFFDQEGKFIGGAAAAALLKDATKDLTEEQTAAAYAVIFGNDAMGVASELTRKGAEGYDATTAAMEAAGTAAEQADKANQGWNATMDAMFGSLDTLKVKLGDQLLPTLTPLLEKFGELIDIGGMFIEGGPFSFEGLTGLGTFLSENVNPALGSFVTNLAIATDPMAEISKAVSDFNPVLGALFDVFARGKDPLDTIGQALGLNTGAIRELGEMAQDIAQENLQRFTDAWNNDVLPAVQTAQAFFVDKVQPILLDLAKVALPAIDAALDIAAGFWEDVLVPAVTTAWNFLDQHIMPILKDVTGWMAEHLPPAIEKASDFFTDTFFPAIHEIYDFIDQNVNPVLGAIADLLAVTVAKALETAAQAWEKYLAPALGALVGFVGEKVKPILDGLGEWLGTVTGGFNGINDAVGWVIGKLEDFAEAIRNLPDLPDVFTPGSPTPAELGMRGFADSLEEATRKSYAFDVAVSGMGSYTPDMQPSAIYNTTSNTSYGGNTVNISGTTMTVAQLEQIVTRVVNGAAASAARRQRGGG
jgi:TP901 family phage tail tape measure protein